MTVLHEERTVPESVERAFAFTADFTNIGAWDPGVFEARKVGDGPVGVGTEYDVVLNLAGSRSPMRYIITEYVPSSRVVLRGEGPIVTAVDTIEFAPAPGGQGTHIVYEADLRLRGIRRLFQPFIGGRLRTIGKAALDGLAAVLTKRAAGKL